MKITIMAAATVLLPLLAEAQTSPAVEEPSIWTGLLWTLLWTILPIVMVAVFVWVFVRKTQRPLMKRSQEHMERHVQHMERVEQSLERILKAVEKRDGNAG